MKKLTDFVEWNQAVARLNDLKAEQTQLERDMQEATAAQNRLATAQTSLLEREALALISGTLLEADGVANMRAKIGNVHRRMLIVSKAIEIQVKAVAALRYKLSQEIAKEARPAYRKLQISIARAAIALAKLTDQETAFRDELNADGVVVDFLAPNVLHGLGTLDDPCSRISYFLADGIAAEHFTAKEVGI